MAGKPRAQAKLHKTKTAAPKKGNDALSKLVNSCNQQVQQIQAMLHQEESSSRYNQRLSALKARAHSLSQLLSRSNQSTRLVLQKILGQAESAHKKLEDLKRNLNNNENGEDLEEMISKIQSAVDQGLAALSKSGGAKKRQTGVGAGKGRGGKN